jgi:hypothetical protein
VQTVMAGHHPVVIRKQFIVLFQPFPTIHRHT